MLSALGNSYCNNFSTLAISGLAWLTFSLSLKSWNHSSMDKYSLINSNHFFHFEWLCPKVCCNFTLPFVVLAMHNRRNRFPFLSSDWHLVPSMMPFLMAPLGKSRSLCLLTDMYTLTCSLSISSVDPIFDLPNFMLSTVTLMCIQLVINTYVDALKFNNKNLFYQISVFVFNLTIEKL